MSSSNKCQRHWKLRAAAAFVAVTQLVAPMVAIAQVPTASSVISSRASASYVDFDGVTQVATSNVVQTTVQQVGSYTVSGGGAKSASTNAPVAVMHTITNTGNGNDTFKIEVQDNRASGNAFASVDVFADMDANGLADSTTSLLVGGAVTDGTARSTSDIAVAAGSRFNYVVVYRLPEIANGAAWTNTARVLVTPNTSGIGYVAQPAVNDTINSTDAAAFSAALTHSAPLVAAAGGGSWGATPSSGERGTDTVYTFNFTNNGKTAGDIYLFDDLPVGMNYQTGTAVWSSKPGVALVETGVPDGDIAFRVTGQKVEALIRNVPPGHNGTLSFKAKVDAAASFGALTSQGRFSLQSCPVLDFTVANDGAGCASGTTNVQATFTVLPQRAVQFGPLQDVTAGTPANATDAVTQANVVAGGSVRFSIAVQNKGNTPDTYKLALDQAAMTFPVGTVFTWFYADGVTPLQNSVGGAEVDTGVISAGATTTVVLQATVPPTTTVATNANLTVKAVANSFVDTSKRDAVTITVTNVISGLVDMTSTPAGTANVDLGPGAILNAVSQSMSITAGGSSFNSSDATNVTAGSAAYDLYVRNHDSGSLTFNLESSLTTTFPGNPPAGWTVSYYLHSGSVAASASGAKVTTVTVPAGGVVRVVAVVTPLSTSSDVSNLDVYFRARSTTASSLGSIISDYVRTRISVTAPGTRGFILSPAGSVRQIAPASVVDFPHVVLNNGSQSCGAGGLRVTTTMTPGPNTASADEWQVVVYRDNGTIVGQIDSGDTPLPTGMLPALAAGASEPLIVRVYSPGSSAVGGASVSVQVTVEDLGGAPNCGSQSLTNTVSVTVGQLEVSKLQMLDASCNSAVEPSSATILAASPGNCIVYLSRVRNNGIAPVTNVSLHDVVPPYTVLDASQPAVVCESSGLAPAVTSTLTQSGSTLKCGSATNALQPGGTITLRYRVRINTN